MDAFEVRLATPADEPEIRALVGRDGHARRGRRPLRPRARLLPGGDDHGRPVRRGRRARAGLGAAGGVRLPGRATRVRERAGGTGRVHRPDPRRRGLPRALARATGDGLAARERERRPPLLRRRGPREPPRPGAPAWDGVRRVHPSARAWPGSRRARSSCARAGLPRIPGVEVDPGSASCLPDVVGFLRAEGAGASSSRRTASRTSATAERSAASRPRTWPWPGGTGGSWA